MANGTSSRQSLAIQTSLGPGPPVQIVLARYHTVGQPNVGGQLTIEVTATKSGWRVSSLR